MRRFSRCRIVAPSSLWFLFLIFFALPYLVDVAYCEDLTPSHFAQAVLGDGEEVDHSEAKVYVLVPVDQVDHIGSGCAGWKAGSQWHACRARVWVPPQNLLLASLTSRPPPIL